MRIVLCLYDTKAEMYLQPFFVPTMGVALRNLSDEVGRGGDDNVLSKHPRDFRLMHLGHWDEDAGVFHCHDPKVVCEVADFLVTKASPGQEELSLQ